MKLSIDPYYFGNIWEQFYFRIVGSAFIQKTIFTLVRRKKDDKLKFKMHIYIVLLEPSIFRVPICVSLPQPPQVHCSHLERYKLALFGFWPENSIILRIPL